MEKNRAVCVTPNILQKAAERIAFSASEQNTEIAPCAFARNLSVPAFFMQFGLVFLDDT